MHRAARAQLRRCMLKHGSAHAVSAVSQRRHCKDDLSTESWGQRNSPGGQALQSGHQPRRLGPSQKGARAPAQTCMHRQCKGTNTASSIAGKGMTRHVLAYLFSIQRFHDEPVVGLELGAILGSRVFHTCLLLIPVAQGRP